MCGATRLIVGPCFRPFNGLEDSGGAIVIARERSRQPLKTSFCIRDHERCPAFVATKHRDAGIFSHTSTRDVDYALAGQLRRAA